MSGGVGALLFFMLNVEWEYYAWAGGVEVLLVLPLLGGLACKTYLQHLSKILL
jgi:hypothetical protein